MTAFLHELLPRIWLRRGVLACLLLPLSWLYSALFLLRKFAYHRGWLASGHPGGIVIVVGNAFDARAVSTALEHVMSKSIKQGIYKEVTQ